MQKCRKVPYPTRWHAQRALQAVQESVSPSRREKAAYPCAACKAWHLTSKSRTRTG
jgi:hypothetical protein